MGWEMNAINGHTSKLHKYTVLDTVLKLENKKVKKNEKQPDIFSHFRLGESRGWIPLFTCVP